MSEDRETDVERSLRVDVESRGGMCLKVVALKRRGLPDRLILLPDRRPFLVETKLPGEKPTQQQRRLHRRLEKFGLPVFVWDGERLIN